MAEAARDILKIDNSNSRPGYKSWIPYSFYSLHQGNPSNLEDYELRKEIIRTLHYDDFKNVLENGSLIQFTLREGSHSHLIDIMSCVKGCWFAPRDAEMSSEHNWYGNVNYIIDFNEFLGSLEGWKAYFMEVIDYRYSSVSRILLTTKKVLIPELQEREYDPRKLGGPWYQDEKGNNFFLLATTRRYGSCEWNGLSHDVELFCVFKKDELKALMDKFKLEAANHASANSDSYRSCKKFRSGRYWKQCPYPWSIEKTQALLGIENDTSVEENDTSVEENDTSVEENDTSVEENEAAVAKTTDSKE